jgi:hypothetical protein
VEDQNLTDAVRLPLRFSFPARTDSRQEHPSINTAPSGLGRDLRLTWLGIFVLAKSTRFDPERPRPPVAATLKFSRVKTPFRAKCV